MAELKDSTIKLFGKTILPLQPTHDFSGNDEPSVTDSDAGTGESCSDRRLPLSSPNTSTALPDQNSGEEEAQKETSGKELNKPGKVRIYNRIAEECKDSATLGISENLECPLTEQDSSSLKSSKSAEQSEISVSEEKTLKKPDKIIPCPRCNSMDTKFCYYNNYNVNQPRHFCKNCQRYWTAGGTMRNVPVGAGRRKNKNASASHYRHLVMSDALQRVQANAMNGVHSPTFGSNGTVLSFGSDSPLCESMASALNLVEKTQHSFRNGFHGPEQRVVVSNGGGDNGDNRSSCSSVTASTSSEKGGKPVVKDYPGFPQVPCFPGPPWPFSWNSAEWTSAIPTPAFCHSGFPVSFYPPPPYWGSTVPGSCNVPCFSPVSSTTNHSSTGSPQNQSVLGKHSRDGEILNPVSSVKGSLVKENNQSSDRCVLIPKTLRIDDPTEAAKSSIWATLGINNEKLSSSNGGGLFKAFQTKGDDKNHVVETSPVLQANPAALSRSLRFLEST